MLKIRDTFARTYKSAVHYFETGDLIPFLIFVSVFHFIGALQSYDAMPVAIAVGIGVDVGMYRIVKAALRYGGRRWWMAAIVVSLFSYGYHVEYYKSAPNGWMLAAPLPVLVIMLAALSHKENYAARLGKDLARNDNAKGTPQAQTATPAAENDTPTAERGTYEQFKLAQLARNGAGPMSAAHICDTFGVPRRTAYNWLARYAREVGAPHHAEVN